MEKQVVAFAVEPRVDAPVVRHALADWSEHWSGDKQRSLPQQVFSLSRKLIFSRMVRRFVNRHFPSKGLFLEAGSGTAETSILIDKNNGARRLVALDIILPVLDSCARVMDEKVCGDIFSLPFGTGSVDGIWNVGVMEHFTHRQIDEIMSELHRVLRRGAPVILFWPGIDSIPQSVLRAIEWVINTVEPSRSFRFHPDEISRLKSLDEGRQILQRSGFVVRELDYGWRSFTAFRTLVATKP
jgi:SAM-dependent methyltransferase